jgi:ATP-dependent HslUV protease subunit HslV
MLIIADRTTLLVLSGNGEVIEPDEPVAAIGSGGPFALAAAKALLKHTDLDAQQVAIEALEVAASICVFTNSEIVSEVLS